MADEGEGSGNKFDDLFDDLDKFFAPIEQVGEQATGPNPAAAPSSPPQEPPSPEESARIDVEPATPEWMYDLEEGGQGEAPGAPEEGSGVQPAPVEEDWARLQDAMGEDVEGEELLVSAAVPVEPADEEPGLEARRGGADMTEVSEPGPDDVVEGAPEAPEDLEPASGSVEPVPEPALDEPAPWEEPALVDIEEVANRLAEEFAEAPEPADDLVNSPVGGRDLEVEPAPGPRTIKVGEPEAMMGGPTWEEPTGSHALISEPPPPRTGRNIPAAVLTGLSLVVVAAISLAVAKWAFAIVAGAVILLGQAELYATVHRKGYQPATALGLLIGALTMAGAYFKGELAMTFFIAFALVLSMLWYMAGTPKGRENAMPNIGSTLLGIIYVPFLASFAFLMLTQANAGRALMLVVIGLTVAYDISAFFFGTFWGSHPLAPTISPKKSREGLLGATVVTFVLAIGIVPSVIDYLSVTNAVGMAVIVSVFAPLGDLAESAIKRDLGVKDMGSILPGHGGVLDRFDSLLFVLPAVWYFLRLIL